MSVRLDEYCGTSQSKLAEALKVAMQNAVFLGLDELKILDDVDGVCARVVVQHSISKTDVLLIMDLFGEIYWQIVTSVEKSAYEVIFYLTKEWL